MKKVITYGTFDIFHYGHLNLLKRAKELGDYLIVGITGEEYDYNRGKLNVIEPLVKRIENVKKTGLADKIIVEEYFGQKIADIQKYEIDIFAIGSDWLGKFDYLKEYCDVVYLERTKGISSTDLRISNDPILNLGIVGNGRIAKRFVYESKYVSGVNIDCVFGRNEEHIKMFCESFELNNYYTNYNEFLSKINAVYIATPHNTHYEYAKQAILQNKHVLCEKPMVLEAEQAKELFLLAKQHNVILQEAIKTAYAPCFNKLINIAKSGIIGNIKDVSATFTKLIDNKNLREFNKSMFGGSFTELSTYPLCAIIKLLGTNYNDISFSSIFDKESGVDIFTKINLRYPNAMATANIGIGVKKEGDLVIAGTKGYIYVPAPWWKTEYFEVRFEDLSATQKFFIKYDGDGLRYELADFLKSINTHKNSYKFKDEETICIANIIEKFLKQKY
ncbi:MAG: Gfo/Idh/MocA family oxidoreductase [Bacteroides sp.]|nr:Gfo/Idh/MocA family oxidoreductase [Bacteroides sp.]